MSRLSGKLGEPLCSESGHAIMQVLLWESDSAFDAHIGFEPDQQIRPAVTRTFDDM